MLSRQAALEEVRQAEAALSGSGGIQALPAEPPHLAPRLELVRTQSKRRRGVPRIIRRASGPLLILFAWWSGLVPIGVFPSPGEVVQTLARLLENGTLAGAIDASLVRVLWGLMIGIFVGGGLAVLSGIFRLGEDLIDATVQMTRTMPWIGLTPLLVIWFGIDETPKIALVSIAVAFPLYLNTYAGIRNVDFNLIEVAHTLGLSRLGLIWHVILPGALPGALVGLRYSLGNAWLALVFSETMNATSGIGYLMNNARDFLDLNTIVLCLITYALLGLCADMIVRLLERVLLPWRPAFGGK